MTLDKLIAKIRNTRDYENLEARLGKELGQLIYDLVNKADKADRELDIVHNCLTELYNHPYKDVGDRVKLALDEIKQEEQK